MKKKSASQSFLLKKKDRAPRRSWVMRGFFSIALVALLGSAYFFAYLKPAAPKLINMHESIGTLEDAQLLLRVMERVGVDRSVLQAIPSDLLEYVSGQVTLSNTDNGNQVVAQAHALHPHALLWFCTLDPLDPQRLAALTDCQAQGAAGVKLYNGYSYAHLIPLDAPQLQDLYVAIAEAQMPLMLPVNTAKFQMELENLLTAHPTLTVIASHYALSSQSLNRVRDLMSRFPHLWVDTSFGSTAIAMDGFKTLSENVEGFRAFFSQFQDRIVWATDNVVRESEGKTEDFEVALFSLYRDILSQNSVETFLSEDGVLGPQSRTLTGLGLSPEILKKVFWKNAETLLE